MSRQTDSKMHTNINLIGTVTKLGYVSGLQLDGVTGPILPRSFSIGWSLGRGRGSRMENYFSPHVLSTNVEGQLSV